LTFDASPLFTATIATTSPLDLSTPNIVKMSLKISFPFPVSAWTGFVETTERTIDVSIVPISNKTEILLLTAKYKSIDE
jgi:hypothetical protein